MKKKSTLTSLTWHGITPLSLIWRARVASIGLYALFVWGYFLMNGILTSKYHDLFVWVRLSSFVNSYKDISLFVHFVFSGLIAHLIVRFYLIFYFSIASKQVRMKQVAWGKVIINFILTVILSIAVCAFFLQRKPDLHDPLGFFAVASFSYLMAGAIVEFIKYFPILIYNFRRES